MFSSLGSFFWFANIGYCGHQFADEFAAVARLFATRFLDRPTKISCTVTIRKLAVPAIIPMYMTGSTLGLCFITPEAIMPPARLQKPPTIVPGLIFDSS